ncbi:regucalcin-like [Pectinophora gossypiella]|uniref:regucalcin-like n=1 Tax=Pectinophora gossypiella TaxID=13191 RepID=UPI00214EEF66|nr:regucalcin-like [Pectinophora gossypiella]
MKFAVTSVLFLLSVAANDKHAKFYKVSMVASEESPSRPAVFTHAESPVWDPDQQALLFVDVVEQNVHRLNYKSGKITVKHIDFGQVNVVTTVADSKRLLVAVRASLFLLDWDVPGDAALRPLTSVDLGKPDNVINEGKADVVGRFWAGTKGPQHNDDVASDQAAFYSISSDNLADPKIQIKPVTVSNGLVWALNNSVLYYIDSPTQKIEAFDYDAATGTISGRRTILDVTLYGYDEAIPDGMTIDSAGNLWVAIMFGGTVLHINPDLRHVIYGYKLPVSRTTSVAWGGPNYDELFVTTSRVQVDETVEPLAGAIFTIRGTGSVGVPHYPFRLPNADSY